MSRAAMPLLTIIADTREQRVPPMPEGVVVERDTLDTGDYTTRALWDTARIERKCLPDLIASFTRERARFMREVDRLQAFDFRLVVVEANLGDIIDHKFVSYAHANSILGSICSLMARRRLPFLFAHDDFHAGRMICGILRRLEDDQRKSGAAA